jgi:hypothetical protein
MNAQMDLKTMKYCHQQRYLYDLSIEECNTIEQGDSKHKVKDR